MEYEWRDGAKKSRGVKRMELHGWEGLCLAADKTGL